ncbi:hypothetical protein NIBR502772_11140 [Pseudarthrobacter sp. NIBRBAC000502772]|uniref:TniQ family protein n=1 Tax=Pseudarthrobacter sp. NIBRBAC000502772 TaxID=2590775 RepID=UPI001131A743|nr:hypothetical protein NIBR502772_11140 [Pseudarthrobacter sp. NIBRBAC000502772]
MRHFSVRPSGSRQRPVHPAPLPVESLSSWLRRIADRYHVSLYDLVSDFGSCTGRAGRSGHCPPARFAPELYPAGHAPSPAYQPSLNPPVRADPSTVKASDPNTERLPRPRKMGSGSRSVCSESVRKGVLTMSTDLALDWAVYRPDWLGLRMFS